ncbi:hypothetical protein ILUMI_12307 [Ignelater luminosus]|uniref:Uncharacterized protein n=1 Tax=Ignelater luminosus TaxID=2038154 RepID=A0A8K0GCF3_IGNLU|nr:hypothetical protein ILUMI_12307 [Ignelater luminosus]
MKQISIQTRKLTLQKWCSEKLSLRKLKNYSVRNRRDQVNARAKKNVVKLLESSKCMSVRKVAKKEVVSVSTVQNIKKKEQHTDLQKAENARKIQTRCVLMDDERYIRMDSSTLPGPQKGIDLGRIFLYGHMFL